MLVDAELNHRINYELMLLERTKKEYAMRLSLLKDCCGTILRRTRPGNSKHFYYSVKRPGSDKYSYLKQSENRLIERVREARFLEEAIRRIDRDIKLMKSLVDGLKYIVAKCRRSRSYMSTKERNGWLTGWNSRKDSQRTIRRKRSIRHLTRYESRPSAKAFCMRD